MFTDYYAILEIEFNASQAEIKNAFKSQALKYHPDRNLGRDTTIKMQQINEAYLILKDLEAKKLYDVEYLKYQEYKNRKARKEEKVFEGQMYDRDYKSSDEGYTVTDDILRKWMENAKRQAVDLAIQTIKDLKGMAKVGVKEAGKAAGRQLIAQIVISIIAIIIFSMIGLCNRS